MKINFMTAFTLLAALNTKLQEIWADKEVTVGEVCQVLTEIVNGLGLKDKVIFEKHDKK